MHSDLQKFREEKRHVSGAIAYVVESFPDKDMFLVFTATSVRRALLMRHCESPGLGKLCSFREACSTGSRRVAVQRLERDVLSTGSY